MTEVRPYESPQLIPRGFRLRYNASGGEIFVESLRAWVPIPIEDDGFTCTVISLGENNQAQVHRLDMQRIRTELERERKQRFSNNLLQEN